MLRCPTCGNETEFRIEALESVRAYVTQHHTDGEWWLRGDLEVYETRSENGLDWDEQSMVHCGGDCDCIAALALYEAAYESAHPDEVRYEITPNQGE